jgi:hypothetical protein
MVGDQFGCVEDFGMMEVGVERESQCWTFVDQPYPGMTSTVDSPLMTFGEAEPPFQVEVVLRQVVGSADEEPRKEAGHYLRHVLGDRVLLLCEPRLEFLELAAAVLLRAAGGIECLGDSLNLLDLLSEFRLDLFHFVQSTVDARR